MEILAPSFKKIRVENVDIGFVCGIPDVCSEVRRGRALFLKSPLALSLISSRSTGRVSGSARVTVDGIESLLEQSFEE